MHTPVLLQEVIESLDIRSGGRYIDATAGEGGHIGELLHRGAHVLAIDRDKSQIEKLEKKYSGNDKVTFVIGNFAHIEEIAIKNNMVPVDGILFDLGLSMAQLSEGNRGLSYKNLNEPLDMRLDREELETAAELIRTLSEPELYRLIARNSEELAAKKIAETIITERLKYRINLVGDLIRVLDKAVGTSDESVYRRIFQAFRIEVNHEFENLVLGLTGAVKITKEGGRIAVITFHSTEDRIVKEFIKKKNMKSLFKKVITGERQKRYERSAKLRIIIV